MAHFPLVRALHNSLADLRFRIQDYADFVPPGPCRFVFDGYQNIETGNRIIVKGTEASLQTHFSSVAWCALAFPFAFDCIIHSVDQCSVSGIRWVTGFGRISPVGDITLRSYYKRCSIFHQPLESRKMLMQVLPCSVSTIYIRGEMESLEQALALLT